MLIGILFQIKSSIIYNSKKIKLDNIHKEISLLGHDTEFYQAPLEVYNQLPDCCQYKSLINSLIQKIMNKNSKINNCQ